MPFNGEYYDPSIFRSANGERWIIARGYGEELRYWGHVRSRKGKLLQKTWWITSKEDARGYSSVHAAKAGLRALRKYHDMLPEWRVRVEPMPKDHSK